MSPERDDYEDDEEEYEEEEASRSIFGATWFRALLIVIILAVVGVLALPYVLDWFGPAKPSVSILKPAQPPAPKPPAVAPPQPPAPPPAPAAPAQPATPSPPSLPPKAEAPAEPPPKPAAPAEPVTPTAPAPKVAEKPAAPAPKPAPSARAKAPVKGDYWVQVGAFREAKNAANLAARLTADKYSVQRATVKRGSVEGANEIFAPGASQKDLYDKVKAKGYRADAVKGGAAVRPFLPLRDAVALSKELTEAGMEVKIRRVGGDKATYYLVRVGGFPDRKEAEASKAELEGKGIPGFVVRGAPR